MAFQSIPFVAFLIISVCFYYFIPARHRAAFLAIISFVFYFFWSIPYAVLLLAVTTAIFFAAKQLEAVLDERKKMRVLQWSVNILLLLLTFFKYGPILAEYLSAPQFNLPFASLLLPLGISYYTFKLISYLVDVYAGKLPAERNFAAFATSVAFFPQIAAGPIQRAVDFLPQISASKTASWNQITNGLSHILFGLFKKLVIADTLSRVVTSAYANPGSFSGFELLLISYFFAIQLYADFSAITDIAIGSALLFGIHTPPNFENPFYARTITEFWKKWHMTLTSWMRDYVFLPLRMVFRYRGEVGLAVSLFLNMVFIGIWHGATSAFLLFGIVHGIYMVLSTTTFAIRNRIFSQTRIVRTARALWQPVITFTFVSLSLILFRAENLQSALSLFSRIFSSSLFSFRIQRLFEFTTTTLDTKRVLFVALAILLMEGIHIVRGNEHLSATFYSLPITVRWTICYIMILMILMSTGQQDTQPFIYFKF